MSGREACAPGAASVTMAVALLMALAARSAPAAAVPENPKAPRPWQAVSLPPLQSDPPNTVQVQACDVGVVGNEVSTDLVVRPSGDAPALLLEGLLFGWSGPSDPYPTRQFPELEIRIDGAAITPEDRYEAYAGSRNITTMLRMAGMDPLAVTRTPPLTAADARNAPLLKALANVAAVEKSGDAYLAKWQTRRIVRIPLDTGPLQHVELRYLARPAVSVVHLEDLDTAYREKAFCLSANELRRVPHVPPRSAWLATEYTLSTSIDRHPAGTVTLSMTSEAVDGTAKIWLFFCGPHGKPVVKRGGVDRAPVEVDEVGDLHALRLVASPEGAGL